MRNGKQLRRFWPENRVDAKFALLLNEATQVVADQFAQDFVDHRDFVLASHRIAELAF